MIYTVAQRLDELAAWKRAAVIKGFVLADVALWHPGLDPPDFLRAGDPSRAPPDGRRLKRALWS